MNIYSDVLTPRDSCSESHKQPLGRLKFISHLFSLTPGTSCSNSPHVQECSDVPSQKPAVARDDRICPPRGRTEQFLPFCEETDCSIKAPSIAAEKDMTAPRVPGVVFEDVEGGGWKMPVTRAGGDDAGWILPHSPVQSRREG